MVEMKKASMRAIAVLLLALGIFAGGAGMVAAQGGNGGGIVIGNDNDQSNENDTDQSNDQDQDQDSDQSVDQDVEQGNGAGAIGGNEADCGFGQTVEDEDSGALAGLDCTNGDANTGANAGGDNSSNQAGSNNNGQTGGDQGNANGTDQGNSNDVSADGNDLSGGDDNSETNIAIEIVLTLIAILEAIFEGAV